MAANHLKMQQPTKRQCWRWGGCLRRDDANKGDGNKGGKRVMATRAMVTATATATTWAMATAMRLAGDKEEKGKGGKGNGDSNEGGGRRRGQG
jgi:hypothetical protein